MTSKKALTFLEILLSVLLLVTTLAGLFASFLSVRGAIERTERRANAFNIARQMLEQLYVEVRDDTYDTGFLALGDPALNGFAIRDGLQYDWELSVFDQGGLRRARAKVTFPESETRIP